MIHCLHNGIVLNGVSRTEERAAILIEDDKVKDVFTEQRFLQKNLGLM